MHPYYPRLFTPGRIGNMELKNRIVMPPMDGGYGGADGSVTQRMIDYYVERAKGGVGLIIVHIVCVDSPQGRAGPNQISLDNDKYIGGMARLAEAIQDNGAKVVAQLHHAGRQTSVDWTDGLQPVAPSPVPCPFLKTQPRELSYDEIQSLVEKFIQAAVRLKKAGFNGAHLHGGHGYLISQFYSPISNKRNDGYGGDFQRRMRFPTEIIQGIRAACGPAFPIMIRFNADEFIEGGVTQKEGLEIARALEKAGADCLCTSSGIYGTMTAQLETMAFKEGWRVYLAEAVKKAVNIPVTTVGVIRTPELAEQILEKGQADFVEIGRGLITDPEWPRKALEGRSQDIRKCITCNYCIGARVFSQLWMSCAQNPECGHEAEWAVIKPAAKKKKVMVVGAGAAGMEAARVAALRGHDVTIFDKANEVGAQLKVAATPPTKDKINYVWEWLEQELKKLPNVKMQLNKEVTAQTVKTFKPDALVIATGAQPIVPDIPGIKGANVVIYQDLLTGQAAAKGDKTVIIGGGTIGCETALFLSAQGKKVTVVEMLEDILLDMEPIHRFDMMTVRLPEAKVKWQANSTVVEINTKGISYLDKWKRKCFLPADSVVICVGSWPRNELEEKVVGLVPEVYVIGDAKKARKIAEAKHDGAFVGRNI
jgi:2,4-dienoyl-CoA reductase-like NADH-dependent reductase (Old Yellow Enzyme family)/NADPH-dependent 2,4-dienoyl-CoA reductase/sulfur reductase-like enzyme